MNSKSPVEPFIRSYRAPKGNPVRTPKGAFTEPDLKPYFTCLLIEDGLVNLANDATIPWHGEVFHRSQHVCLIGLSMFVCFRI